MSRPIQFFLRNEIPEEAFPVIPAPIPATQGIGDWFEKIQVYSSCPAALENPHAWRQTVKGCSPFLDAMTTGYLIRSFCDVEVEVGPQHGVEAGRFRLTNRFDGYEATSYHESWQFEGHPLGRLWECNLAGKFHNPWIVKTPPGVSCLFCHPRLNDPDPRFYTLAGVVATDVYPLPVELPFLVNCKEYAGKNFMIRTETPLSLVIPFRREDWKMHVGTLDSDSSNQARLGMRKLTARLRGAYNKYWRRHSHYR
jgi:hypothetical protein